MTHPRSRSYRLARILGLTAVLVAIAAGSAGAALTEPAALVIQGNDRTLAAVTAPAGPAALNLAALGAFPNDIVVRGSKAYVVCSGAAALFVYDLAAGAVLDTIDCGAGSNPWAVVLSSDSRAYVSRLAANDVLVLDLPAGTVAGTIPVGLAPEGMALAAGRLFVANSGFDFGTFSYHPGTVSVIDLATSTVSSTLPVGLNPQSLAVAPNGEVHALCSGDYFSRFGRAFLIDPLAPGVVDSLDLGASPGLLAIDPSGAAYASDYFAGLLKYDTATRTILRGTADPIAVGVGAAGIDFGGGRTWVCVFGEDLLVALDANDQVAASFPLGDGPQDVAFYTPEPPIAVRWLALAAEATPAGVELRWSTGPETEIAGFGVERALDPAGPWVDRTGGRPVAPAGRGEYRWLDAGALSELGSGASYWYRVVAIDRRGRFEASAPTRVDPGGVPRLTLAAPAPNPAIGGATMISFILPAAGRVRVALYDAAGREVARLLEASETAGRHELQWNGIGAGGRSIANGSYFVRAEGPGGAATRRLVVLR